MSKHNRKGVMEMLWGKIIFGVVVVYGVWVLVSIGFLGAANLRELRQCSRHIKERAERVKLLGQSVARITLLKPSGEPERKRAA